MNTFSYGAMSARQVTEDRQLSMRDVMRLLRYHLKEVLGVMSFVIILAVAYAFLATPIYSADVLVRVDAPEPNAFGIAPQGQVLAPPSLPPTVAEIAIMQSRSVIEPVIRQFQFDVVAEPRRFPVLGLLAEKFATPGQPASAWLGLDSYAWGGELFQIAALSVPAQLEDQKLVLTALGEGNYLLSDEMGRPILRGTTGQVAQASGVSLLVSQLVARPNTRFMVTESNAVNTILRFERDLKITDDGKGTGVVGITFSHRNAIVATQVANAIAQSYIAAAIASHQADDGKTLAFLRQELPRLQADLERAEAELTDYRISSGSMQPVAEAQIYLQGGIDFQRQVSALQIQRTQLLQQFTPNSPEVANLDRQLDQLNAAKHTFDTRFSSMPASERKNADLTRNAKVAESIYVAMVSKVEELAVRRAATSGNAHIVDVAIRPSKPIKPDRLVVIGGGILVGAIAGVMFVIVRRHVFGGVIDPMFIERHMSLPLLGTIPHSLRQFELDRELTYPWPTTRHAPRWPATSDTPALSGEPYEAGAALGVTHALTMARGTSSGMHCLLARSFPQDAAVEALRGVRTALWLELLQAPNKIVALTGPTVATGKSFVAANLAVLLAQSGSRVLLIDADMRCGHLARFFGQANAGGLAEVLGGALSPRAAIRPVGIENLSLMSCGTYPSNPSELLMMHGYSQMLASLEPHFDLVLIDTPPFLVVTDAAITANRAGTTMLVLRSGTQTSEQIETTLRGLDRTGARLAGAVFNGVPLRRGDLLAAYGYSVSDGAGEFAQAVEAA